MSLCGVTYFEARFHSKFWKKYTGQPLLISCSIYPESCTICQVSEAPCLQGTVGSLCSIRVHFSSSCAQVCSQTKTNGSVYFRAQSVFQFHRTNCAKPRRGAKKRGGCPRRLLKRGRKWWQFHLETSRLVKTLAPDSLQRTRNTPVISSLI